MVDVDGNIVDIHSAVPFSVGGNVTTHHSVRVVAGLNDAGHAVGVLTLNVFRRLDATDGDASSIDEVEENGDRSRGVENIALKSASASSSVNVGRSLRVDNLEAMVETPPADFRVTEKSALPEELGAIVQYVAKDCTQAPPGLDMSEVNHRINTTLTGRSLTALGAAAAIAMPAPDAIAALAATSAALAAAHF